MPLARRLFTRLTKPLHHANTVWIIFGLSTFLTLAGWAISNRYVQHRAIDRFTYRSDEIRVAIQRRMLEYEQVIRGGIGLFNATDDVNRDQWRNYVESLKLSELYPGIQGLGFSKVIRPAELGSHIAAIRAEGFYNYEVKPPGVREEYTSIIFLEPFLGRNLRAFGYDMFSEPVRRAAMENARDTGRATVSGIVELVQENGQDVQRGFLMYSPVYRKDFPVRTAEERRNALIGYVYSPFRIKDLMNGIVGNRHAGMEFDIFDGDLVENRQLFSSAEELYSPSRPVSFQEVGQVEIAGRKWLIRTWTEKGILSPLESAPPFLIAACGLFINLLLFAMIKSISSQQRNTRKLAHEIARELEDERERFALIVEASPDGVWDWNLTTDAVYFSPSWKNMLGYDDHELPNSVATWLNLIHVADRKQAADFLDSQVRGTSQSREFELRLVHRDGSHRWILSRCAVLRDANGIPYRMLGTNTDITERKFAELGLIQAKDAAQAAAKAKAAFLATMSHEIRTPMNGVIGVTKLLLEFPLKAKEREYVETIRFSAESLLTVINDVLDFSKIDSGKLDLEKSEFDLKCEIDGIFKTFRVAATSKSLDLVAENAGLTRKIKGDNFRLRQILNNLIGNAIKFTDSGLVKFSSKVTEETDSHIKIKFSVMDSGIGLSQEAIQRIFMEFSQADSTMSRRYGGSGLGLTISKRLIELMGGEIHVSSQMGIGSTFWFELPFEKGAEIKSEPLSASIAALPAGSKPSFEGLRVLVAEDNRVNQLVISAILQKFGCQVEMAANGVEALWALNNSQVDLILMDCQMPEMDGFEATTAIRMNAAAHIAGIPIIALTANAIKGDREVCLHAGMNGYVSKPVDENELRTEMTRLAGGHAPLSPAENESAA